MNQQNLLSVVSGAVATFAVLAPWDLPKSKYCRCSRPILGWDCSRLHHSFRGWGRGSAGTGTWQTRGAQISAYYQLAPHTPGESAVCASHALDATRWTRCVCKKGKDRSQTHGRSWAVGTCSLLLIRACWTVGPSSIAAQLSISEEKLCWQLPFQMLANAKPQRRRFRLQENS